MYSMRGSSIKMGTLSGTLIVLAMVLFVSHGIEIDKVKTEEVHDSARAAVEVGDEHEISIQAGNKYLVLAGLAIWEAVDVVIGTLTEAEVVEAGVSRLEGNFVRAAFNEAEEVARSRIPNVIKYARMSKFSRSIEVWLGGASRRIVSETKDIVIRLDNLLHPNVMGKLGFQGAARVSQLRAYASSVISAAEEFDLASVAGVEHGEGSALHALANELSNAVNLLHTSTVI